MALFRCDEAYFAMAAWVSGVSLMYDLLGLLEWSGWLFTTVLAFLIAAGGCLLEELHMEWDLC